MMPVTLPGISRRKFLTTTLAGAAGVVLTQYAWALETPSDPNYFVLFSDIHLNADRQYVHNTKLGRTNPWENFARLAHEALRLPTRPAGVLVNGDVACKDGLPGDYETALAAMEPLRQAGLTVHWALGNHDDRANMAKAAAADPTLVPDLTDRRVLMLSAPSANIFVLDSLDGTDHTPGLLGSEQLAWLAKALDRHADRPAIVFVHHQPYLNKAGGHGTRLEDYERSQKSLERAATDHEGKLVNTALIDTLPLLHVLLPRRHVKAYFFGHTHEYSHKVLDGLHLVNLPATAWIFSRGQPLGWMDMQLAPKGAELQLHCLDPEHPLHNDRLRLRWRA